MESSIDLNRNAQEFMSKRHTKQPSLNRTSIVYLRGASDESKSEINFVDTYHRQSTD